LSRDGAVNRSLNRDELEIEHGGFRSPVYPTSAQHSHSRGQSESQNLLQDIESGGIESPRRPTSHSHSRSRGLSESQNLLQDIENGGIQSPRRPISYSHSRSRGQSESQNLLPYASTNLFEYSSTKELTGYQYNQPEVPRPESPMWTGIPQTLRTYRKEKWQILLIDILAFCSSFPLFALAGCLIWFDGKEVTEHQLNIFNECIKVVSLLMLKYMAYLIPCRHLLSYLYFSLLWLVELRSNLHLGNLNGALHLGSWSS